jgi:hypothetical protein
MLVGIAHQLVAQQHDVRLEGQRQVRDVTSGPMPYRAEVRDPDKAP